MERFFIFRNAFYMEAKKYLYGMEEQNNDNRTNHNR